MCLSVQIWCQQGIIPYKTCLIGERPVFAKTLSDELIKTSKHVIPRYKLQIIKKYIENS